MTGLGDLMESYREESRILAGPMEPPQRPLIKPIRNASLMHTDFMVLILPRVKLTIAKGTETY